MSSSNDSSGSEVDEPPYAWLWQTSELADVALEIVFTTPQAPSQSQLKAITDSAQRGTDSDQTDSNSEQQCRDMCSQLKGTDTEKKKGVTTALNSKDESSDAGAVESSIEPADITPTSVDQQVTDTPHRKTYLLHSQVISSNSAFLRASLTSVVGAGNRKRETDTSSCKWHIRAQVEIQDEDAVEAVLRYFYKQELEIDIVGSALLSVMKVADLWQARGPALAASRRLCLRSMTFPFTAVYSLPSVLQTSRVFKSVMAAASVALLATFGNTHDIIASASMVQRFTCLPQPALLALLRNPELMADAEASVLLLLSTWFLAKADGECSEEDVNALNSEIRYSCLSNAYLTDLCDVLQLPILTREQLRELWAYSRLPDAEQDSWTNIEKLNPLQWYLPPRPRVTRPDAVAAEVTLDVTVADLRRLLAVLGKEGSDISLLSPAVYADGFMWMLEVCIDTNGSMWCLIIAKGIRSAMDWTDTVSLDHSIPCHSSIVILAPEPLQLRSTAYHHVTTVGSGQRFRGPTGQFKDAAQFQWWKKYIVEGRVRFSAAIKSISD